jgi:hypothetical protein
MSADETLNGKSTTDLRGRLDEVNKQAHTILEEAGDTATLFQTSAGWAPESTRTGYVVDRDLRPIAVIDLFPRGRRRRRRSSTWRRRRSRTTRRSAPRPARTPSRARAHAAVGARSGRSHVAADHGRAARRRRAGRSYVDGRLGFFVRQRLDSQLLVGDGIAPNLKGFLNATGLQTQAKGADPTPDAVYKAMTVRVTGRAFPNAPSSTRTTGRTSGCSAPPTASTSGATRRTPARSGSGASAGRPVGRDHPEHRARRRLPDTGALGRGRSASRRPVRLRRRRRRGQHDHAARRHVPSGAIITDVLLNVDTVPTSGGAATISVDTESAADMFAAAAISGAPWSTTGAKLGAKTATTAPIKTTASRAIKITVATATLTAGKFQVAVRYFELG